MNESYDVIVIGGGAAGLSGAVALARSRRSVLVVDAGEPRNRRADQVHNLLTRDGTPPADLYAAGRAEVITSAAAGLMAGAAINADLVAEDARHAVTTVSMRKSA